MKTKQQLSTNVKPLPPDEFLESWIQKHIRRQYDAKAMRKKQLAKMFHVSEATISRICKVKG